MVSLVSTAGAGVLVTRSEGLASAVVSSTIRGTRYETVVFKATFELSAYGPPREVVPEPVLLWDVPRANDPRSSVAAAAEGAPFMPSAAVLLFGHGHAPKSSPHGPFRVRLALYAGGVPIVDKHLHVVTETGAPVPLVYEEALGRPDNPAGTTRPRITDPRRPDAAIGVGPIAASWPQRATLLRGVAPPQIANGAFDLGQGVDGRFFNPAPFDQQPRQLDATETLLLEGVDPEQPRWTTHLGGASVAANVVVGSATPKPLRLGLDMLVIDAARRRFSLVWRSLLPVTADEVARGGVRVEAALRSATAARSPSSDAVVAIVDPPRSGGRLDTTGDMPAIPQTPALPFGGGRAAPGAPPASSPSPFPGFVVGASPMQPVPLTPSPSAIPLPPSPIARDGAAAVMPFAHSEPPATATPPSRPRSRLDQTVENIDLPRALAAMPFAGQAPTAANAERQRLAQAAIPATPYDQSYASKDVVPARRSHETLSASAMKAAGAGSKLVVTLDSIPVPVAASPAQAPVPPSERAAIAPDMQPRVPLFQLNAEGRSVAPVMQLNAPLPPPPSTFPAPPSSHAPAPVASLPANAEAPAAPPPPAPPPIDDRGDAKRGSVLARLASGGVLRDMDLVGADLSDLELSKQSFTGSKLAGARFQKANLAGANLVGVSLVNAVLDDASLVDADLTSANLAGASMRRAAFSRATLTRAELTKAQAEDADFSGAKLESANLGQLSAERASFTGADLTRANAERAMLNEAKLDDVVGAEVNLERASLVRASCTNAQLTNAKLAKSSLDEADLSRATLDGVDFIQSVATDARFDGASLAGASLRQVRFEHVSFVKTKLAGVNMSRADFSRASFDEADLTGVDARGSRFANATFRGANLHDTDFRDGDLTGADVSGAAIATAKLKGAKPPRQT